MSSSESLIILPLPLPDKESRISTENQLLVMHDDVSPNIQENELWKITFSIEICLLIIIILPLPLPDKKIWINTENQLLVMHDDASPNNQENEL